MFTLKEGSTMIEGCGVSLAWFQDWNWKTQSTPSQQIASAPTLPAASPKVEISAGEPQKQGTFWGWLSCKFAGMNFTGGGVYDEYTGQCSIKGEFIRVIHGR
jgi:hypothetical protein